MPRRASKRSLPVARLAAILVFLLLAAMVALLAGCPPARRTARIAASSPQTEQPPSVAQPEGVRPGQTEKRPGAPGHATTQVPPEHPQPEKAGLLSIIIDDAGYSLGELQAFLDLPMPLTIAVLPNLPHSTEAARRVRAAGKDLILHCPMEPTGGENPGPGALYTGESAAMTVSLLDAAFASVPGAIGMNNHMGSRATADPALMTDVIGYLKSHGLLFIDSRTTTDTVGARIAREQGVRGTQRDVFIDDVTTDAEISAAFEKGVGEARDRGTAVLIGHVQNRGVVDILRAGVSALAAQGVRFARLSDVIEERDVIEKRERNPVQ